MPRSNANSMTSSATSTEADAQARNLAPPDRATGPDVKGVGHFFLLLSMVGAIVAVALARETHPAALLLLSAAVVAAGLVGLAFHRALVGFFSGDQPAETLTARSRSDLEREKALALRSIKELEFDHAMGKLSDADFSDLAGRLRARAIALMQELERAPAAPSAPVRVDAPARVDRQCASCHTQNDPDARFCKQCGAKIEG